MSICTLVVDMLAEVNELTVDNEYLHEHTSVPVSVDS